MGPIEWEEPSRVQPVLHAPLVAPRPGKPVQGIVVSAAPLLVWTHYNPHLGKCGHDTPHTNPAETCEGCRLPQRPRQKGYITLTDEGCRRRWLVALTLDCLRHEPRLLPGALPDLRGRAVHVFRTGNYATAPVRAKISKPVAGLLELPGDLDVMGELAYRWGVDRGVILTAPSLEDNPDAALRG